MMDSRFHLAALWAMVILAYVFILMLIARVAELERTVVYAAP